MEDNKMPWWKQVLSTLWYGLLAILVIPFVFIALAGLGIVQLIQFWTAPKGCCRAGCNRCPWGDLKYWRHRKDYRGWKIKPRVPRS
jgi:hypothetical protein